MSDAKEKLNPKHYGDVNDPYRVINVIEAWGLNFHLGNVIKYIVRAGKKNPDELLTDLDKAIWYLKRYRKWIEEKKT